MVYLTIDLSLNGLAAFAVAIGTVILAIVTYKALVEGRKQLSVLRTQTVISRSQLDPYLLVRDFNFKGDKLFIDIENIGRGHATWLSLRIWFHPCTPRYYADKEGKVPLTKEQTLHLGKTQGWALGKFEASQETLRYREWKSAIPVQTFSFLGNKELGDVAVLLEGARQQFEVEPYSGIKRARARYPEWKGWKFDEFRQFLAENKVGFVALEFQLACKDSVENIIPGVPLCKFVMDPVNHKSLEEAFNAKISFDFFPLTLEEVARKGGFMPSGMYYELKSSRNVLEPWKED